MTLPNLVPFKFDLGQAGATSLVWQSPTGSTKVEPYVGSFVR